MKANNERRKDPLIRAEVEKALDYRKIALAEALPMIKEAIDILMDVPYLGTDDEVYTRGLDKLRIAFHRVRSDSYFLNEYSDTYVGNMAAFELGEEIERDLNG